MDNGKLKAKIPWPTHPKSFFSKFAGQGYFVDVNLIMSASYLVRRGARTKPGQADKKKCWDSGTARCKPHGFNGLGCPKAFWDNLGHLGQ